MDWIDAKTLPAPTDGDEVDLWAIWPDGVHKGQRWPAARWEDDEWRMDDGALSERWVITHWMRVTPPRSLTPGGPT